MKCGKGHLETPNGATFEGQFNKGLPNGLGMMRFPDGSRYEGEFMQGWFHGHGVFTTKDGAKFEGMCITVWKHKFSEVAHELYCIKYREFAQNIPTNLCL